MLLHATSSLPTLSTVFPDYFFSFFFFNDTATTEIYPLSLHDALPICPGVLPLGLVQQGQVVEAAGQVGVALRRSEEHTSELQSRPHLVCRLLLEKKKTSSLTSPCAPAITTSSCSPLSASRLSSVPRDI